jgi:cytochrome c peroxidase
VNLAFASAFMYDGRAGSLEQQALLPLFASNEMDMTGPEIEARLAADTFYVRLFRQAYGPGRIKMEGVVQALATYQRSLISCRTPFDRWQAGDESALSTEAKRGALLFSGKAGCAQCHVPPLFTDGKFHNIGLDSIPVDRGRAHLTGLPADEGAFKTPTLRNVAVTGPYMHDGRFESLEQVIGHYNAGGRPGAPRDVLLRPLGLTEKETLELLEFLRSLDDPYILEQFPP